MELNDFANILPSNRQLKWQKLEFYGFIHFGINTFYEVEWGKGHEALNVFNPEQLNAEQWVNSLKSAGMKGVILTCKHHDGFCLWPSKYSTHTIASTPWKNGKGNIVLDVSKACEKYEMAFGIYLSPWDMTEITYGQGKEYDDFFVNQLEELLTGYGDIFEVWFDGANGEGANGKKQFYDWDRYYHVVRKLQPNAVISICGPDVRWVGNEAGKSRINEYSVVPKTLQDAEKIAEHSQKRDDGLFSKKIRSQDQDLGSRKFLEQYQGEVCWYPAEVDVSIRPRWFYHQEDDDRIHSLESLWQIYLSSVGNNCCLLLNVPPNKHGLIANPDIERLQQLGGRIEKLKSQDLMAQAAISVSQNGGESSLSLYQVNKPISWVVHNGEPVLTIQWPSARLINLVVLKEAIDYGQRIDEISVSLYRSTIMIHEVTVHSVGYQKIISLSDVEIDQLDIQINSYRECARLEGVYVNFV